MKTNIVLVEGEVQDKIRVITKLNLIRNNTQTAVTNMTKNRMLENKII